MTLPTAYSPPPNPGDTLKRVLVIKLGALGDFVQALGAMRVVRATHPSARITLLTTEPFSAFAKACPYFDIVEDDGRPRDLRGRSELIKRLRSAAYDMVYDFQNNDRTAQYFAGLTGKKPYWSGAAQGSSHQHRNPNRAAMHNFDRLAEQLVHAGLGPRPKGDPSGWRRDRGLLPYLDWIRPAFRDPPRFQPEFFGLTGPYALVIPGSSADHPEKRWPAERFTETATWLADAGVTPVVVGGKPEGEIAAQIARAESRARNIVGRTDLFQLATLSERAQIVIGGDTGPMHMAAAAGAPGVCLFQQEWTPALQLEHGSIWNPQTRLGRAAPRGDGGVITLTANTLEEIGLADVRQAVRALAPTLDPPVS
ncbi:lipopolysaccharide heptosyltransferase family protein [bacterium]|nr:lipopolysaccharide heptosyltransferase family protein [bacterium]